MLLQIFALIVIFVLSIIVGLHLSDNIQNDVIYILFWIMYAVSFITIGSLVMVSYFYNVLRKKQGPPGPQGIIGENGEPGDKGSCETGCQNNECNRILMESLIAQINKDAGNPTPPIKCNNIVILERIRNICNSDQFEQVVKIKSASEVINYLSTVMADWGSIIYQYGGREYIERMDNPVSKSSTDPIDIIKQYDVYYWGSNKLFKPITVEICDDPKVNKDLPQGLKPRLKIIKTNRYNFIYDDRSSGARDDVSTWRPKPVFDTIEKRWHYPMGDIGTNRRNECMSNKSIDGKKVDTVQLHGGNTGHYGATWTSEGPDKMTAVVAGDVKPPVSYSYKWNDRRSGGRFDGSFWRPNAPPGYTCLGDITNKAHSPPALDAMRCVPTECVEEIPNTAGGGEYIWNDRKSGARDDGSVWGLPGSDSSGVGNARGEVNYNLIRTHSAHRRDPAARFFKIRDSCLNPAVPSAQDIAPGGFTNTRWFGSPDKDPKYSVFTFLGLIPEGTITNKNTNSGYYFQNSIKYPNVYFIKDLSVQSQYGVVETSNTTPSITLNMKIDYKNVREKDMKDNILWNFIYTKPDDVLIQSKLNGKYLGAITNTITNNPELKLYDKPDDKITKWSITPIQ